MEKKLELSAEDREMTIGFANNILPLAFEDVALATESKERTLIQKRYMGADASMGMMTVLVEEDRNFILDIFVSSNRIHGKSVHLQVIKNGVIIEATIRNNRMVDGETARKVEMEPGLIQELAEFITLVEDDAPTPEQRIADGLSVDELLLQMQEQRKQELIDQYLESGEFEKIIALQNGAEPNRHLSL